jgi:hypothetical protein
LAQRVFGIALVHEDLVDYDPVLATLTGKPTAKRKGRRRLRARAP